MALTPGASRVVITLDLIGQREAVAGLTETTDALERLGEVTKVTDEEVVASTERMAGASGVAYGDMAKATTDAADEIKVSNDAVIASSTELADAMTAASDKTVAAMERTRVASETSIGTGKPGGKGLLDMLTSMKALVIGGLAYESVKVFSGYQTALTKLGTIAGLTSGQLKEVNKQIMTSAVALRTSPTALAGAYYNPISEGFGLKSSSYVVAAAAKEANMTGAPLAGQGGTAYALSTLLQTYGHKHPSRAQAMAMAAMMHGVLTTGDMSMQQLLAANSTGYFNVSQQYGMGFKPAASILDFFSSQGVSPRKAATRMNETLALMTAPSTMGTKYWTQLGLTTADAQGVQGQLSALGLTTTKLSYMMHSGPNGFQHALEAIGGATKSMNPETRAALYDKLFGGGRTGASMMALLNHPELLASFQQRVNSNSTVAKFNSSYAEYTHTFQANLHKLGAQFAVAAIAVGKRLVPAFNLLVSVLSPIFKFASGPVGSALVGLALGGVAVIGMAKMFGKMGGYLSGKEGSVLNWLLPKGLSSGAGFAPLEESANAAALALDRVAESTGASALGRGVGTLGGAEAGMLGGEAGALGSAEAGGLARMVSIVTPLAAAAMFAYMEGPAVRKFAHKYGPKHSSPGYGPHHVLPNDQYWIGAAWNWVQHLNIDHKLGLPDISFSGSGSSSHPTAGGTVRMPTDAHSHNVNVYIDGKQVTSTVKKHVRRQVARA